MLNLGQLLLPYKLILSYTTPIYKRSMYNSANDKHQKIEKKTDVTMLNGVVRRLNGWTTKLPHQYLIWVSAYFAWCGWGDKHRDRRAEFRSVDYKQCWVL